MAVKGQTHIALDTVGALPESEFVGGQGVLGSISRGAAVGHHERAVFPVRSGGLRHELRHRLSLLGLQSRVEFLVSQHVNWRVT